MNRRRTERFDREDYDRLPEGYPAELLGGRLVREPPPVGTHRTLIGELLVSLRAVLGSDRVLASPVEIVLGDHDVLRPDLAVLRKQEQAPAEAGSPLLPIVVFEIVSPSTAKRDRGTKPAKYLAAGIEEVWLVDPRDRTIEVRSREGPGDPPSEDRIDSRALPGFGISFAELEDRTRTDREANRSHPGEESADS